MITSIKLNDKIFEGYSIIGNENLISLNKINVFIGKNNSGKSRFLRSLLKNKLDVETTDFDSNTINGYVEYFKKDVVSLLSKNPNNREFSHFYQALKDLPELFYVNSGSEIIKTKDSIERLSNSLSTYIGTETALMHKNRIIHYLNKFNEDSLNYNKIYIPILRGLRPLQIKLIGEKEDFLLSENNYLKRIKSDYSIEIEKNINVHTGLDLYEEVKNHLLGDHDDRLKIQNFEKYLSGTFFQGEPVNIVPRVKKDVLYIKIGEDKQRPIYDLGEGIQSIILLTYPLFFNEGEEIIFFIEEPELHLHPGLERVLIETLRDPRFDSFQYFITTHSNHILDLTLEYDDISIYSFQKKIFESKISFLIQNVSSNHKQVLDLLGVRNSSVFLANCTIWVEGITDRLYLRKYLEVLQKLEKTNFKEDYHFSFIEYAGNNITHWSFLESDEEEFSNINIEGICSKIFLIADNDGVELPDKKKSKKQERQNQLKEKLGEKFYITKGQEIENLLSKSVIKKVITETESYNTVLDFSDFDRKDYSKTYLGDFIEKNVKGIKKKYCSEYGTIYDKVNFCKKAVSKINSIDDLSEEANSLAILLLSFIKNSNA